VDIARSGFQFVCLNGGILVLLLLLAGVAFGQPTQFTFDPNGNLLVQSAATLAPPQILAQPQPQVLEPGELASFFVVAANTRGLAYQWRFNDTNLSGATSDALLRTNVSGANEGQYSVVLSNSSGSVTSAPAALMIDADRDGLPESDRRLRRGWHLQSR